MGIRVLNDPAQGYAALYDSTSGVPLPIEIFGDVGPDPDGFVGAEELAELFLGEATAHFETDLRTVAPVKLREYQSKWFKANLKGHDWSLRHASE